MCLCQHHPLDGEWRMFIDENMKYQYFLNIVPIELKKLSGRLVKANQLTVTEMEQKPGSRAFRGRSNSPIHPEAGVYFNYDFSPVKVVNLETRKTLLELMTSCFAIIGGIFTVGGMVNGLIHAVTSAYSSADSKRLQRRGSAALSPS
mmetsp:Transcript_4694/g.16813  ORF Transcript_4694/g.16813 Transcript_4694/m.16813 type:complete len:147 (+) Transcript_4694:840-1280(+)